MAQSQNIIDQELSDTPGHLLRICQQRSHEIFRSVLGDFGLTQQQTALLIGLAKQPDVSIQQLADLIGTDRNTLSDVASRMLSRGLIVRQRSPRDARAYQLRMSDSGTRLLKRMAPGLAQVQTKILESLAENEREAFVRMARSIANLNSS